MPEFSEHNGQSAKRRAEDQKRKRNHRSGVRKTSASDADKLRTESGLEKRREEKNKDQKQKTAPNGDWFDGVPEQVIHDFKALRRKLRAEVTKTAMDGIKREAARAGITLTDALRMCCERGWRGFKAEWVQDRGGLRGGDADQASPASMRRLA